MQTFSSEFRPKSQGWDNILQVNMPFLRRCIGVLVSFVYFFVEKVYRCRNYDVLFGDMLDKRRKLQPV